MDKQIEEMEKDIAVRMAMAKGVAGSMNNGVEGWLGKYLIEKGWIKPAENAVVLTDKKDIQQYEWSKLVDKMGVIEFGEKLCKETAEKFAERLKLKLKELELGGWVEVETKCFNEVVDKIAKEFTEGLKCQE